MMNAVHQRAQLDRARGECPTSQPDYERTAPAGVRYQPDGTELRHRRDGILPTHAKARRLVRLPDGRTARLVHCAPYGNVGKVRLSSGAFLNVHVDTLQLLDDEEAA